MRQQHLSPRTHWFSAFHTECQGSPYHQLSQLGHITMTLPESHSATPVPVRARSLGSEYRGAVAFQVHSGWIRQGQTGFATGAARERTPAVGTDEDTGFS